MIRLRGHHLICLHFFLGEGYDPEFVENLREILRRAEAGDEIDISTGPDDVCRMCPYLEGTICSYSRNAEDEIREMDRTAIKLLRFTGKRRVKWMDARKKIPKIFSQWSGRYCIECDWRRVCERQEGFRIRTPRADKPGRSLV